MPATKARGRQRSPKNPVALAPRPSKRSLYLCVEDAFNASGHPFESGLYYQFSGGRPPPCFHQSGRYVIERRMSPFHRLSRGEKRCILRKTLTAFFPSTWGPLGNMSNYAFGALKNQVRMAIGFLKDRSRVPVEDPNLARIVPVIYTDSDGKDAIKDDGPDIEDLDPFHSEKTEPHEEETRRLEAETASIRNPSDTDDAFLLGVKIEKEIADTLRGLGDDWIHRHRPIEAGSLDKVIHGEKSRYEFLEEKLTVMGVLVIGDAGGFADELWDRLGTNPRMALLDFAHGWHKTNRDDRLTGFFTLKEDYDARVYLSIARRIIGESGAHASTSSVEHASPAPSATLDIGANAFFKEGDVWQIRFEGESIGPITDWKGMPYIAQLLAQPGKIILATEMEAQVNPPPINPKSEEYRGISEEQLEREGLSSVSQKRHEHYDKEDLKALKESLDDFDQQISQAEQDGDLATQERLMKDKEGALEFLEKEMRPGGKFAYFHDDLYRAGKRVGVAITRSLSKIKKHSAVLGGHLRSGITAGEFCTYSPHPPVEWTTNPSFSAQPHDL